MVRGITPLDYGVTRAGSDLSESQIAVDGQTVTFTLLGEETRDRPRRRGFLRFLRDHQGCEQSGGIGRRRFQYTSKPPANTHAYPDTYAHAYTHTHSRANSNPNPDPDTRADIDANAATDCHGDAGADHRADAHSHARADANRHIGARTDCRPCGGRAPAPRAQESSGGMPAWLIVPVVAGVVFVVGTAVAYVRRRRQ